MKLRKKHIIGVTFLFCAFTMNAQVLTQLNAQISINLPPNAITSKVLNDLTFTFTDYSGKFTPDMVRIGDVIIDEYGNSFEIAINSPVATGSDVFVTVKCLNRNDAQTGYGVIYRPTSKGFPLMGVELMPKVLTATINSALLVIDGKTANYVSGSNLPASSVYAVGTVVQNPVTLDMFRLLNTGWSQIDVTTLPNSFASPPSSEPPGTLGDVVFNNGDGNNYYFNGTTWVPVISVSALPTIYKFGDIFFVTGENKLYMFGSNDVWTAISGSSVPVGPTPPPTPKPGDLFFDSSFNILYVYDTLNNWVEVSTNGSTPTGNSNPPVTKGGSLFYNTAENKMYVSDGTQWTSFINRLTSGQIFIGNTSNIPVSVPLSGDATINNIGQLTIKNNAITNSKLDKVNIPIDGFGIPMGSVMFGDGVTNQQLKHVALPSAFDDAATKSYVDMLFASPSSVLGLPTGTVFVGNALGKAASVLKSAVPISDFGKAVAAVSMGTIGGPYFNITNLANPAAPNDAVTKVYVDNHMISPASINLPINQILVGNSSGLAGAVAKTSVSVSDFGAATADILMGGKNLKNLNEPTSSQDAATMNYVDSKAMTLTTNYVYQGNATNVPVGVPKASIHLSDWGAAIASVSMGGTNLTNLADPVGLQDAATKKYVDGKNGSITTSTTTPVVGVLGSTFYNTTEKTFYISDGFQWLPVNNILPTGELYVGDATNKAVATPKNSIPLSGFGAPIADIAAGAFKITGLADPTNDQDAATKKYVDVTLGSLVSGIPLAKGNMLVGDASGKAASIAKSVITLSGFGDAESNISMGTGSNNYKIINVANPTGDQDAATKYYVDKKVITPTSITLTTDYILVGNASNQAAAVAKSNVSLSEFGAITSNLSLAGYQITNMADPVTAQDAVTKKYVDNSLASFSSIPSLTLGYLFVGDATNKALATAKNVIPLSGFAAAAADVDLGTHKLVNVTDPSGNQDAATKKYVDTSLASFTSIPALTLGYLFVGDASNKAVSTVKTAIPLSGFGAAAADVDLGTHKLINVTDPSGNQDAATKNYVDLQVAGVKLATIGTNTLLGNNTASTADAVALTPLQVKTMLSLNNVDNTSDATKNVLSATKLTTTIKINGVDFNGSTNITIPGDNLGNHTATQNIKMVTFALNNDGVDGKGLTFETTGNAVFAQDVTVDGNFYTPSDQRLKTNIVTLGNALQAINSIRGVRFEYKDQKKYAKGPKIGVIAQELLKVFPEMVTKGTDGFFKVDYTQLSAVLIQAVKEQQNMMHQQQLEINELKVRLDKQQLQINAILKKID